MLLYCKKFVQTHICPYWKTFVIILTPLFLLPLLFLGQEARAGYGVLIIVVYWLTSALPVAVTGLLPIVLFPLMNIMSTAEVCSSYLKESNVVFFGGVVMALGVEKSNLHRRIALRVMLIVGSNPRWLMLGLMTVGTLLSMWISNAGVTAMLIPIVDAVVDELFPENELETNNGTAAYPVHTAVVILSEQNEQIAERKEKHAQEIKRQIKVAFLIAVCYAANIGGIGTIIGSGAPLAFQGILEELYGTETGMSFAGWMAVGTPVALFTTLFGWVWLQIYFNSSFKAAQDGDQCVVRDKKELKCSIRKQCQELGPITFYETSVIFLFSLLILLWFFKDPKFMPGWKDVFPTQYDIGDATVAIAVVVLAFILPSTPRFWCFNKPGEEYRTSPALLDWAYVQRKFPWNVLLVLGGGYVISDAFKVSGLSLFIGNLLSCLSALPHFAVMFLVTVAASALTEIASNTAVVSILLPIVAKIGEVILVNPLYLMIPVTIGCCHTFMLPVGTPPNAMVYSAGKMGPGEMMKAGVVMNIIALIVLCAVMETVGVAVFNLHAVNMPDWINGRNISTTYQ